MKWHGVLCAALVFAPLSSLSARELFNNWNKAGVGNGPTRVTQFALQSPTLVREIMTYHWNHGRGQTAGSIALYSAEGRIYGPWQAVGTSGTGGAQNVNWKVSPNLTLPAGTYTVVDSDIATWSCNAGSQNAGFTVVSGGEDAVTPPPPPASGGDGQATLISLRGDRDLVGPGEGVRANGAPDAQVRVVFQGRGRVLKAVELRAKAGALSVWDTLPSNGMWQMAVVKGGTVMTDASGALRPFTVSGLEVLDLYVHDIGGLAGATPYDVNLFFQDGSKQAVPLVRR